MVLETPFCPVSMHLKHETAVVLVYLLAKGATLKALQEKLPLLPSEVLEDFIALLLNAKVCAVLQENEKGEEYDPLLTQWEFHDLFFHSRSRKGRHNNPLGGIYPFIGTFPSTAVVKETKALEAISLFKPDLEELKKNDLPFSYVLEERRSIRENKAAIEAKQLGEFLFRCARIKQLIPGQPMDLSLRPYPNGGAAHELELYPIIHSCQGISAGLYRYNPKEHQLLKHSEMDQNIETLLIGSMHAMRKEQPPKILIIIAARFQRVSWKYRSIAYALTLKNTGVLMQTMYLVATAMKLAPCANGAGDSDLFCRAAGTNYLEETSVGEFALN